MTKFEFVPHPYLVRAMKKTTPEKQVRSILRSHIRSVASTGQDVENVVDACYEKLKGYLKLDSIPVVELKDVPRALSDGTACEVVE